MVTVYPIEYEICDDNDKNHHVIEIFATPLEKEGSGEPICIYPLVEVTVSTPRSCRVKCESCSCCSTIRKFSCLCLFVSIVSLGGIGIMFH